MTKSPFPVRAPAPGKPIFAYYARRQFCPDLLRPDYAGFDDSPTLHFYGVASFWRPLTESECFDYGYSVYDAESRDAESDAAALYRSETRGAF